MVPIFTKHPQKYTCCLYELLYTQHFRIYSNVANNLMQLLKNISRFEIFSTFSYFPRISKKKKKSAKNFVETLRNTEFIYYIRQLLQKPLQNIKKFGE